MKIGVEECRQPADMGGVVTCEEAQPVVGRQDGQDNDQDRRWEDPAAASPVEGKKADPAGCRMFPAGRSVFYPEKSCDHETGDDEGDVDPHEAAGDSC